MATEIERKFLVVGKPWIESHTQGTVYTQGYLSTDPERVIRVRMADSKGYLTIKSKVSAMTCAEYEYEIPHDEAKALLETLALKPYIEKIRYKIPHGAHIWDVDVFSGENTGLVVAEIELKHENEAFTKPQWLGDEVTKDMRYKNANLATHPFSSW